MLGKFLKRMRTLKGWSKWDAAEELGLTTGTYENLENDNTKNPKEKSIEGISKVYNIPVMSVYYLINTEDE